MLLSWDLLNLSAAWMISSNALFSPFISNVTVLDTDLLLHPYSSLLLWTIYFLSNTRIGYNITLVYLNLKMLKNHETRTNILRYF